MQRKLVFSGFIPLPWFAFWTTIAGLTAVEYSPVAQHVSALSLLDGTPRDLFTVGLLGTGAGICVFAIALWRETQKNVSWGAILWLLYGVSMLSNGIWPMGSPKHGLYAIGLASILAPAVSLLELERLQKCRMAHTLTLFVSVAGLCYLWLVLTGFDPAGFRGLTQRIFSSICSAWPAGIAWILLSQSEKT